MVILKTNWIVKLKNSYNGMKLVLYADGRVYLDGTGPLIGTLKSRFMKKIEYYINEYAHYIKIHGYEVQDRFSFIAKFWDSSNKKRDDLSVRGWPYEREFLDIVLSKKSYQKFNITDEEFISIAQDYCRTAFNDDCVD